MKQLIGKTALLFTCAFSVAACGSTINKSRVFGTTHALSIDAKQRVVLFNDNGKKVCAEPSPDALVAQASALSAQLDGKDAVKVGGAIANSITEKAGSLGSRTQSIQILRDGYYRLCEAFLNGAIGPEAYQKVVQGVDETIAVVLALDALSGVGASPQTILQPGTVTTTISKEGDTVTAESKPGTGTPATNTPPTVNEHQAAAIVEVLEIYLKHDRHQTHHDLNIPHVGDRVIQ